MTTKVARRAWMALLLTAALAAVLLMLVTSASKPAEAAPKFKFVTKTVNNNQPIEIEELGGTPGPAEPYPSARFVGGFPAGAKIADINLTLRNLTHNNPQDVDMMLAHKDVNRTVFSDTGAFFDVEDLTITLDDQAQAPPPAANPLSSGTFKPVNRASVTDGFAPPAPTQAPNAALQGFNGKNPEGAWKLFVQDDANFGAGSLENGWSLRIRAKVPTN